MFFAVFFFFFFFFRLFLALILSSRNSYDRDSIEAWLQRNATSPVTRAPLSADRLAPNRALKEAIEAFRASTARPVARVERQAAAGTVKVAARAFARAGSDGGTHDVVLSLEAGAGRERTPVDLVAAIDISGSMQGEATASDESGKKEEHGLSLLDVTKHAVATVIGALGPGDRLALVSYSDAARVEMPLLAMNAEGKKKATAVLEGLHTEGSTNLWDGLLKSMDVLRAEPRQGRIPSVFLLTDGQPNVAPPRGHLEMLKRYRDEHKNGFTIQTFGFGYSLDSHLLDELAIEGGGAYAFVPEPTFVGTCFVNALSNTLVTAGADATLSVENVNGAKIVAVLGDHQTAAVSWGGKIFLGTLQHGQVRHVVVRADLSEWKEGKPYFNATLQYVDRSGEAVRVETAASEAGPATAESTVHFARSLACTAIGNVMATMQKPASSLNDAAEIVKKVIRDIRALESKDPEVVALLKDLEGQVTEATAKSAWFQKWGRHYLPSLKRAHQLEQCNNFKDPGVQSYGGDLFQKLRDMADAVFLKLPPPKPSIKKRDGTAHHQMASMAAYNNSAAVCFSPESLMLMADGTLRRCDAVRAGDCVSGGAIVRCVVKTHSLNGRQALVRLSPTMRVTPWHPVCVAGRWTFPVHLAAPAVEECEATWNFVLDRTHSVQIGGVLCCTLGHGVVDDASDVRSSEYWGRRVVDDLATMPGFDRGFVQIMRPEIVRSQETGLVAGLRETIKV